MQAMDEEQEQAKPNDLLITSETTRLELEPRPPGGGGLVLHLTMMECHTWLGIGGRTGRVRRPRRLCREIPLALDEDDNSSGCCDCNDRRRRQLIVQAIKNILMEEMEYRCLCSVMWDKAVPQRVERDIGVAAHRGGATGTVRVDIEVHFVFVYSEPDELLRTCYVNGGGGRAGRTGNGGDGETLSCSICFEEMSREADEVRDLPGCTHSFHLRCIDTWFQKASTCPLCRRDQLQYLRPGYRDLHHKMAIDPDGLMPDYL